MKTSRSGVLLIVALLVVVTVVSVLLYKAQTPPDSDTPQYPIVNLGSGSIAEVPASAPAHISTSTNLSPEKAQRLDRMRKVLRLKKAGEFEGDEKADLAKNFAERFKPAIERWCKAYDGRVPFKLEDVTLDAFTCRIGGRAGSPQYLFKVDGYTLAVIDNRGDARVSYLSDAAGMKALNTPPTGGYVPDIRTPVTKDDVLRMAQADTGIAYQPNQVTIAPSGPTSSVNGGAFVEVNRKMAPGGAGELMTGESISMVFGSNGKLMSYLGPFNLGPVSKSK